MGKKLPPSQTKHDQHESVQSPLIRRVVATPLNHHRSASEAPKFPSICNLPVVNVIPSTLGVAAVAVDAVVACVEGALGEPVDVAIDEGAVADGLEGAVPVERLLCGLWDRVNKVGPMGKKELYRQNEIKMTSLAHSDLLWKAFSEMNTLG